MFKSIWTKQNPFHYFEQSIILIRKRWTNGNHGTMEINHTSHIRTPSGGYGKLRGFICAYTLYNHVQTSADIINHWSKQISDNIHHTHSRYYNIDKTAKSFRNIQNILLIVSLIPHTPQGMHYKASWLLLTCKRPISKKTVRKPCTGFRSLRQSNKSEVFF